MENVKKTLEVCDKINRHLIVAGGTGIGKSINVLEACREMVSEDNIFTYRGHSRTESIDFIGMYVRYGDTMVFNDGILTSAFIKAKTEKVIVFIDEIGRIPDGEKDLLIGFLTENDKNEYTIDTGRGVENNGRFSPEVISVPAENLIVVGTTNLGDEFMTSLGDQAFEERFIVINMVDDISDKIKAGAAERLPEEGLEKFNNAVTVFTDMANNGGLKRHMNFRFSNLLISFMVSDFDIGIVSNILVDEFNGKYVTMETEATSNLLIDLINMVDSKNIIDPELKIKIDSEMETIITRMEGRM